MLHLHKYKEIDRYLIATGEDLIILKCEKCEKEKTEYSMDTLNGLANAPSYKEWEENKLKKTLERIKKTHI